MGLTFGSFMLCRMPDHTVMLISIRHSDRPAAASVDAFKLPGSVIMRLTPWLEANEASV